MRLYLIVISAIAFFQCSCGQSPKTDSKNKSAEVDSAKKAYTLDSTSYIPKRIGWTSDYGHLFLKSEIESLDSLLAAYERKTTTEIAVAIIDSLMMGPIDFEPYTFLMIRTWGVGKKEKNNGILIVIAPDLRRIRIQNGYGIEKYLTNEQTKTIIDSVFTPYFREGKFYEGTKKGILAIMDVLKKNGG